jgi:hypothetical protein
LVIRSILVADHHRASLSQARMIGFNANQKSNDVRDKKTALQPMDWIERRCRNDAAGRHAGYQSRPAQIKNVEISSCAAIDDRRVLLSISRPPDRR